MSFVKLSNGRWPRCSHRSTPIAQSAPPERPAGFVLDTADRRRNLQHCGFERTDRQAGGGRDQSRMRQLFLVQTGAGNVPAGRWASRAVLKMAGLYLSQEKVRNRTVWADYFARRPRTTRSAPANNARALPAEEGSISGTEGFARHATAEPIPNKTSPSTFCIARCSLKMFLSIRTSSAASQIKFREAVERPLATLLAPLNADCAIRTAGAACGIRAGYG